MNTRLLIIIDTGVLYGLLDKSDGRHKDAKAIMLRLLKGNYGSPVVADYAILETITLLKQRKIVSEIHPLIEFLDENKFKIYFANESLFRDAMNLSATNQGGFLSLADSFQIVLSRTLGVKSIATFDSTLANFFENSVGKGFYELLSEKEKRALSKSEQV